MVRLKQFVAKRKSVVDPRALADFNAAKADTGAAEAKAISADNGGFDPPEHNSSSETKAVADANNFEHTKQTAATKVSTVSTVGKTTNERLVSLRAKTAISAAAKATDSPESILNHDSSHQVASVPAAKASTATVAALPETSQISASSSSTATMDRLATLRAKVAATKERAFSSSAN
jgi:hypothetical protein